MDYSRTQEAGIIDSWQRNAVPWTQAVRAQAIESRRLVTDEAIISSVLCDSPTSVIDLGCGEGWLIRALAARQPALRLIGYDVVPALIERARMAGGGEFHVASYEAIAAGEVAAAADVVVCNFSLLGETSVDALIAAAPRLLTARGSFIVQTLHPVVAGGSSPYQDGWRSGSWAGFGSEFSHPAPWYFRTLGTWLQRLTQAGLRLKSLREPLHPLTGQPVSVIFVADVMR
jgi:2-polyprenyl-3-methyl-5-hydroxy-6-metoxy-1,4-benzoquinol methylase